MKAPAYGRYILPKGIFVKRKQLRKIPTETYGKPNIKTVYPPGREVKRPP
jgi:hypothetical protein